MTDQQFVIKYRLLGAIVFISLGVIFLPVLMDGEGLKLESFDEVVIRIPDEPVVKEISLSRQEIQQKITQDYQNIAQQEVKSSLPLDLPAKSKKALKLTAWAVQVATYHQEKQALRLKNKLVRKKYAAYVEKVTKNNKEKFKVKVGPLPSKQEADKMRMSIAKVFKVKPIIVNYP